MLAWVWKGPVVRLSAMANGEGAAAEGKQLWIFTPKYMPIAYNGAPACAVTVTAQRAVWRGFCPAWIKLLISCLQSNKTWNNKLQISTCKSRDKDMAYDGLL